MDAIKILNAFCFKYLHCLKMRVYYWLLSLLLFIQIASAQNYQIGQLDRTFTDPGRSNRQIPCKIYYPANSNGNNAPVASGQFPVLVFGHGFVMPWSSYDIYWLALASKGYIMVFPTTESSLAPSHLNFGRDLAFLCSVMKAEGNLASSPFYQSVDSNCAVMGHSMGGGSAFLALEYDSSITAMVTFAPAVTNPSSVLAARNVKKPALVFSGANDCVTPPMIHQIPMYDSLASDCKSLVSITGGDHCQFASFNFNCSLGQSTCSPKATIDAASQQNLVFSFLLPWLDFYLKKDCISGQQFQNLISSAQGISSKQNCALNCGTSSFLDQSPKHNITVYPNPCNQFMRVSCGDFSQKTSYSIFNAMGQLRISGFLDPGESQIDLSNFPEGFYQLRIHPDFNFTFSVVH